MNRRRFLATTGAGTLALPGCLSLGESTADESTEDVTTTEKSTVDELTASEESEGPLQYRLRIRNRSGPEEISVALSELSDDGEPEAEVLNETYDLDYAETLSLDEHISDSTDYEVRVDVTGGASDEWHLYSYMALTIGIESADNFETTVLEV